MAAAAAATVATLMVFGCIYALIEWPRPVSQFRLTMASLPLGITEKEADALIGAPPDRVEEQDGVVVSGAMMYAATNRLSAAHGEPQTYSLRIWERDGIKGTVAIDRDGLVAGRWTWRER